jgi:hypothetical protein
MQDQIKENAWRVMILFKRNRTNALRHCSEMINEWNHDSVLLSPYMAINLLAKKKLTYWSDTEKFIRENY